MPKTEVYTAPVPTAPADKHAAFRSRVLRSLQVCDKVIVVAPDGYDVKDLGPSPKIEVVHEHWEAAGHAFAATPSSEGRRSQLDDIFAQCLGNIIGPVPEAAYYGLDDDVDDGARHLRGGA